MRLSSGFTLQHRRLLLASGVVAAVVFGPIAADWAMGLSNTSEPQSPNLDAPVVTGLAGAETRLSQAEDKLDSSLGYLPEAVASEMALPPGVRDVRTSGDGSVVGFVAEGDAVDVMDRMTAGMVAKGWSRIALGGVEGATFVKSEGKCTWAMVTATQVGGSVSVVVRCA